VSAHHAAVTASPWSGQSLDWRGLIEAGQACLRLGGAVGARPSAEPEARRAYFAALYRACRENSFEGILCTAEAFAALGDHEAVEECLGLAELQADGAETRRMAAFIRRLGLARAPLEAGVAAGVLGAARTDAAGTEARDRHDA
jgi:hypothetical protein